MKKPVRPEPDSLPLSFLYHSIPGRMLLKWLTCRRLSSAAGAFLDSALSRPLIAPFIRHNRIPMEDYEATAYRSFNDFFCRKIRDDRRPIDRNPDILIAPCDGLLSAYPLEKDRILPVKQSCYSLEELLAGDPVWRDFTDGMCLVFRLCVRHYHRYCYVDRGKKGENHFIAGQLHTVRPIALRTRPVFTENCREYTVIDTENFGRILQMEVGAMLVGRIANYHGPREVERGEEKGCFRYGGSTVILLLQKDAVRLPQSLFRATEEGLEVPVQLGERIGRR